MNIKHNINYFKKSDALKYIGIALMVGGGILFIFAYGLLYLVSLALLPIGITFLLLGVSGKSNDADIDACIKEETKNLYVKLEDSFKYKKRILKHLTPETLEGYEYNDTVMIKRTKEGALRSSEYTKAIVYILSDELYITERNVSLTSQNTRSNLYEIPYDMIKSVDIVREDKKLTFLGKVYETNTIHLVIKYGMGTVLSLPMQNDVRSLQIAEKINNVIKNYKQVQADEASKGA
ncbi:MAG: hypothetical protein J6B60_03870 [Clostridia bacterium]|nr:hypothetical protein [Clostridia bacterium]